MAIDNDEDTDTITYTDIREFLGHVGIDIGSTQGNWSVLLTKEKALEIAHKIIVAASEVE